MVDRRALLGQWDLREQPIAKLWLPLELLLCQRTSWPTARLEHFVIVQMSQIPRCTDLPFTDKFVVSVQRIVIARRQ